MRAVSNRGSERREDAGRGAERWPSEAETPERRAHTPCAASPGGYEAAPRRQHREAQDAEDNIGGYYAGLGWRGRLISHAPQLGRTGGVSLLTPVYESHSPAPLTRGRRWRATPNRGFRLPAPSGAPRALTPSGGERREVVSGNRSRGDSARDAGGEGRSRGRGSAPGRQHRRGAGMLQCGGGRGIFLAGEGGLR